MKKTLLLLSLPLLLAACQNNTPTQTTAAPMPMVLNDGHTAENSLDWAGTYSGLMPCADCEGIQTKLTLKQDKTYVLDEHYVKNGNALHPSKQTGRFQFDAKQPSLIRLEHATQPRVYFIGEGFAEARDIQTGEKLSEQLDYRLKQAR